MHRLYHIYKIYDTDYIYILTTLIYIYKGNMFSGKNDFFFCVVILPNFIKYEIRIIHIYIIVLFSYFLSVKHIILMELLCYLKYISF
jgi:hypothetical protein